MEKPKRFAILRLPPQEKPVYFVVPSMTDGDDRDMQEYFYEEHLCPSNFFLGGCELIIVDSDTDPHGLFELVRIIDEPEFLKPTGQPGHGHDPTVEWPKIIPEAFEKP